MQQTFYDAFSGIPTGNLCDSNGLFGAMNAEIQALDRTMTLCGPAMTVACAAGDNYTIHKAIAAAKPGCVLVVNCGGYRQAGVFGEMFAISCRAHGIAGVVIDGSCRDRNEIIDMGFPVFARGFCPNGTTKKSLGAIDQPMMCGGLNVLPGDVVVGDGDGVVVIPQDRAEEVLKKAQKKKQFEDELRPQLAAGKTTCELMGL